MLSDWLQGTVGDGPVIWETGIETIGDARYGELACTATEESQSCLIVVGVFDTDAMHQEYILMYS